MIRRKEFISLIENTFSLKVVRMAYNPSKWTANFTLSDEHDYYMDLWTGHCTDITKCKKDAEEFAKGKSEAEIYDFFTNHPDEFNEYDKKHATDIPVEKFQR